MTFNPEIITNTAYIYDDVTAVFAFEEVGDDYWCRYFGARYYDPNISIWLSVDPLSDEYPSHSPYTYTQLSVGSSLRIKYIIVRLPGG